MSSSTPDILEARQDDDPSNGKVSAPKAFKPPPHISELDGLRGLAAMGTIVYHYLRGPERDLAAVRVFNAILRASPVALDIFFILSGFLIGGILLRTKESPNYYKTFYLRRMHRIWPIYYLWIGLYFALYFVAQGWGIKPGPYSTAVTFATFLLLIQNFFSPIVESTYIVAPTWTLAVEEQFYLLTPFCVRWLSKRRLTQLLVAVLGLAALTRGFLYHFIGHGGAWGDLAVELFTPCRADALAIGVLVAIIWSTPEHREWVCKRARIIPWGMLVFTALGTTMIYLTNYKVPGTYIFNAMFERTVMELSCLSLFLYVLTSPKSRTCDFLRSSMMRELGKLSYCLYLIHWGVLWFLARYVVHTKFGDNPWLDLGMGVAGLAISFAIAKLSWRFVESPLIKRGHKYSY